MYSSIRGDEDDEGWHATRRGGGRRRSDTTWLTREERGIEQEPQVKEIEIACIAY
jgi:hypothetical protein